MHRYELFQPGISKLPVPSAFPERFRLDEMSFPEAERACQREAVWLDERVFRAGPQGIDDAVAALRKLQAHADELGEIQRSVREEQA